LGGKIPVGRAGRGFATFSVGIAKIICFVAIILFVISAVVTLIRGWPTMA
jgi:uncharacterized membrane protein YtjA (UPF0391 family)